MAHPPAEALELLLEERQQLEAIAASPSNPHRMVREARGLLLAGDGVANTVTAERLAVSRSTVLGWRSQFLEDGVAGVGRVRPGRGRKPSIPAGKIEEIVERTQHETPPDATHWSVRTMAKAAGVGPTFVHKIWRARGLKPHLVDTFKVSTDPAFEAKLVDVVALYLNPPDNAVVLSVDEKSQVQALDRTQPSLPMKPGRAGTMTHDYKRNGTTTLFAALNVITGLIIGKCLPRHRHQEFLVFLKEINRRVARGKDIHLIVDNYGTHTQPEVVAWLDRQPRFHLHFTPTSSSWLNLVERWFRELTTRRLKRGSFASVAELVAAIEDYIAHHNRDPKPFVWHKTADEIIAKVRRGRVALDQARAISRTPH
ncbi:MAG: IS630 family transposase [Thermoleophilaceae bacterium]